MANRNVVVSWDVQSQNFAAGTALGGVRVTIGGGQLPADIVMDVPSGQSASFSDIPEESESDPNYTYAVQQLDAAGADLGAAITGNFSVLAPPSVLLDVPSVVTITVN